MFEVGENTADGEFDIYLGTPEYECCAMFSPDGRWITYVSQVSGRFEVYVAAYPSGQTARVSTEGGRAPMWSHDGDEIFFLNERLTELWAAPIATDPDLQPGRPTLLFRGTFSNSGDAGYAYDVAQDERFVMVRTDEHLRDLSELIVVQHWFEELTRLVPTP